jgi:short-subunit dehydrogenase involved in D-alanine esterification of teichoic acids
VTDELFDLTDSVPIVTGGGTGIGAATARMIAEHGADVIVAILFFASDAASHVTDQTPSVDGGPQMGGIPDV